MISAQEMIIRLLLGAVLGGIIGFERQSHGRPAGFRTQLLVCVASVLFMIVSEYYFYLGNIDPSYMRIDPGRIAQGAITGVGFLGAGVILKTGLTVQGLTTAACIWIVSAVGIAIGAGFYLAGTAASGITVFALWVLRRVESRIPSLTFKRLTVTGGEGVTLDAVSSVLRRHGASVGNVDYEKDIAKKEVTYNLTVSYKARVELKGLLDELSSLESVLRVTIRG
ncbi:MAG: MgtC/SapB family protein [Thermodesulfovibrionales bacterium]|nr:MgtC/SapB family protein [Thermodesulfovibrionales bacterium]